MLKRIISMSLVFALLLLALSVSASTETNEVLVVKEFELIEDDQKLFEMAEENVVLPNGERVVNSFSKDGEEVELPTYTVVEPVKTTRDLSTSNETTLYRVTTFTPFYKEYFDDSVSLATIIDQKDRNDPTLSYMLSVRAYYEGQLTKDNSVFTRISKYEGKYERKDSTVTINNPRLHVGGFGETWDGDFVGSSGRVATEQKSITTNNSWVSITPAWSSKYIVEGAAQGQYGRTDATFTRSSSTWHFEVILEYGFY